jgi:methylglutaconyl-CoA hydratase
MTNASLLVSASGPVVTLTLSRPEKRNALDVPLLDALHAAILTAGNEPTCRVLVLRGAGRVFCAGLDLTEAAQPERAQASAEALGRVLLALAEIRLVTIAALHGAALAGGAGLASVCDFAIATEDTKFGFPEVRRGLAPALIMSFLRRQLRERDLREVLIAGKLFDAAHARSIGLLNAVVADDAALELEIKSLLSSILQGSPEAIASTKKLLAELQPRPLKEDLDRALAFHLSARNSPEAREGVAAFNEKRPPKWARQGG